MVGVVVASVEAWTWAGEEGTDELADDDAEEFAEGDEVGSGLVCVCEGLNDDEGNGRGTV